MEPAANACRQGTDCSDNDNWLLGWGVWPEALLDPRQHAGGLGTVCLNQREAEEEFVTEPGTMLLVGSGVMGLAGHAGLRLSTRR